MTMKTSLLRTVLQAVDTRFDELLRSRPYRAYGEVSSVDTVAQTADVYVSASPVASTGFVYSPRSVPAVGDRVRVVIDPRGDRYIEEVYAAAGGAAGAASLPAGSIIAYGGSAAPSGFVLCDGASLLRTGYADLFAAIGTAYGSVDSTHFNVPDLRQRFPLGKAASGTGSVLGASGGLIDHTHTSAAHSHSHTHTSAAHSHSHSHTITHTHSLQGHTHPIAHTHASAAHSHPLSDDGWAQAMMTASGGNWMIRMRRIAVATSWASNLVTGSHSQAGGSNATEGVATALDGDTDSTTPGSTGGSSAGSSTGPSVADTGGSGAASTGTDASSTTPGVTGSDAQSTTPGATGANNPPFQTVNYVIKT